MARSRNLKPGFFTNDQLAEIPPLGRLLFAGLWTLADRAGRLQDRPKRIKVELLPYDDCDPDAMLDELSGRGFIERYEANGERYIQVVNFSRHQNPHVREPDSSIPPPAGHPGGRTDEHGASTGQEPDESVPSTADSPLPITDSPLLIPDSGQDDDAAAPQASEPEKPRSVPKPKAVPLPSDWSPAATVLDYATTKLGLPPPAIEYEVEKFRDYYGASPSKRYSDWDATLRNWLRRTAEERPIRAGPAAPNGRRNVISEFDRIAADLQERGL